MFKDLKAKLGERLKFKRDPEFSVMEPEMTSRDEIFMTLMAGVYDPNSDLSKLRGIPHLVKLIFDLATNETFWKKCIRLPETDLDARIVRAYADRQWNEWRDLPEKWDSVLFLTEVHEDRIYNFAGEAEQDILEFPPPKDININMMPFILSYDFKDSKLPKYLEPYWKFIAKCSSTENAKINSMWFPRNASEIGKVCYLTIQESAVETGKSQRRPGLHVDCPGKVKIRKTSSKEESGQGARGGNSAKNVMTSDGKEGDGAAKRYRDHHWGLGGCYFVPPQPHVSGSDGNSYLRSFVISGGIFMASSVEESCRAWNCKIVPDGEVGEGEEEEKREDIELEDDAEEDQKGKNSDAAKDNEKENDVKDTTSKPKNDTSHRREAIGKLGNVEHLRHLLPEELAQIMKPNRLYWMTDRTPHESLPLKTGTYRQFFRLVMSQVSLWYEDHSTPNPNGVKPDSKITKIVRGNKFDKSGIDIVA